MDEARPPGAWRRPGEPQTHDHLTDSVATLLLAIHDLKARDDVIHVADELTRLEESVRELLSIPNGRRLPPAPGPSHLSSRELHVLTCVATGLSNKQVARRLGISERTVGNHLSRIFRKLGVMTRTEAVVTALQAGTLLL